ncbi:MAG: hypothetical protein WA160_00940 [Pseudobdellovibrio sp.]
MKKNKQILSSVLFGVLVLTLSTACTKKNDPKAVDAKSSIKEQANTPALDEVKTAVEPKQGASTETTAEEKKDEFVLSTDPIRPLDMTEEKEKPVVEKVDLQKAIAEKRIADKKEADEKAIEDKKEADRLSCIAGLNTPEKTAKRKADYLAKEAADFKKDEQERAQKIISDKKTRVERIQKKQEMKTKQIAKSDDTEKIKISQKGKISFKNLKGLIDFSDTNLVLFHSKVMPEAQAIAELKKGNEDSFCRVEGAYAFNAEDYLNLLSISETRLISKEFDIYETRYEFINSNGTMSLVCSHASTELSGVAIFINFMDYLNFYNGKGAVLETKNYLNSKTEERMLNVVQISDLEKMKKIIAAEDVENFALLNGQLSSLEQAYNLVAAGNEQQACVVAEKAGEMDTNKIYYRVDINAIKSPDDIPTGTINITYKANNENYFKLSCLVQKTTQTEELFKVAKGVLKFGAVGRLDYKMNMKRMEDIEDKLQPQPTQVELNALYEADGNEITKECSAAK